MTMKSAARPSARRVSFSARLQRRSRRLRVVDLSLRPAVQLLEDRSYPGQAPGVMGWALAGTGLAFLDQSLLTFPLDGGEAGRPSLATRHAESGAAPTTSLPADVAAPLADQVAAWVVSLNAGESQQAGPELQAGGSVSSSREEAAIPAGTWQDDLLPDALAGPLAQGSFESLGDSPTPHHPFSLPSPSFPAAESGDFTLPSGPRAAGIVPPTGSGPGNVGPSSPALSEADLTALAATPRTGTSGNPLSPQRVPDAAMLQTLADNGSTWNGPGGDSGTPPPPQEQSTTSSRAQGFAKTPLRFEANQGQLDAHAQFVGRANGYNLYLTATEMVLALDRPASTGHSRGTQPPLPDQYVIRMQMIGANPNGRLTGVNQLPGARNYLQGADRTHWLSGVPSFTQVAYHNLYPGIDMLFYGNDKGQLAYDFSVTAGANPAAIQLAFTGPQGVTLDGAGNLVLQTPFGNFTEHAPIVYQVVHGVHRPVTARYVVPDAGHVGFQIGAYNHSLPLVIDPYFSYSGYLGGSGTDAAYAIAVDAGGNAYVAGETNSLNFPSGSGIIVGTQGGYDAFVSKLDPSGNLAFTTILAGTKDDIATGIAVDTQGTPYVAGYTSSANFPTTPQAYR
jgi:hypothetical protein